MTVFQLTKVKQWVAECVTFVNGGYRMSWWMAVFTFVNAWCITLFAVLPLCIERGEHDSQMEYKAAPRRVHWRRIVRINTVVALLVTAALALIIKTGIVPVK